MNRPNRRKIFDAASGTKIVDLRSMNCTGYFGIWTDAAATFSYKVGPDDDPNNMVVPEDPQTTGADGTIGTSTGMAYIPFLVPLAPFIEITADAPATVYLFTSFG